MTDTPLQFKASVLIVEDDIDLAELYAAALTACGYKVCCVSDAESALQCVDSSVVDVIVTVLELPQMNGLALCEQVVARGCEIPIIVMTAHASVEAAVGAMRQGAQDFLTKPFQLEELVARVHYADSSRVLRDRVMRLRHTSDESEVFGELLGTSAEMRSIADLLARVADSPSTVLIGGESGTGKEVVARSIHAQSKRRNGPFVAVNCSAVPHELLESELFGHTKGAFTGAADKRVGLFAQAHGGTLFLDEIGEMPLTLQPKLLRALQERVIRPLGSTREIRFDARLVCATNRDLDANVAEGRFREDLFFRINVIRVGLPPLRTRGHDILLLAQHFLSQLSRELDKPVVEMAPEVAAKLLAYHWPGNVRELRNCIERGIAVARFERLVVNDLPEPIRNLSHLVFRTTTQTAGDLHAMDDIESRHIRKVMDSVGYNKSEAARILGFNRKKLYRKLARYGIRAKAAHRSVP